MILQIVSVLFILGFAAYMWKLGLFHSIVMFICCLFAGGLAVTCYEYVADATGLATSQPKFGTALCFGLTFLVALAIFRFALDYILRYEVALPMYVDKGSAAAVGIFSGMIMIAVPIIMLQLMPMGRSVWMYQPYDENLEEYSSIAPFGPDDFLLGLGNKFSSAAMGCDMPMTKSTRELKLDWMITRNTAGHGSTTYASGDKKLLQIVDIYKFETPEIPPRYLGKKADYYNIDIRMFVDINAAEDDRWWRLPATQFALYAKDKYGKIYRHFPVGYLILDYIKGSKTEIGFVLLPNSSVPICELSVVRSDKQAKDITISGKKESQAGLVIDWVYQIPENQNPFEIRFRNEMPVRLISRKQYKTALPIRDINFLKSAMTSKKNERRAMVPTKPDQAPEATSGQATPPAATSQPTVPEPLKKPAPLNPASNLKMIKNRNASLEGMQE